MENKEHIMFPEHYPAHYKEDISALMVCDLGGKSVCFLPNSIQY